MQLNWRMMLVRNPGKSFLPLLPAFATGPSTKSCQFYLPNVSQTLLCSPSLLPLGSKPSAALGGLKKGLLISLPTSTLSPLTALSAAGLSSQSLFRNFNNFPLTLQVKSKFHIMIPNPTFLIISTKASLFHEEILWSLCPSWILLLSALIEPHPFPSCYLPWFVTINVTLGWFVWYLSSLQDINPSSV